MISRVAVVSLNWNGLEHLKYFLPSVSKIDYDNYFTIIVDNGSVDSSVSYINTNFPEVRVIQLEKNLGYSKGFNKGIESAIALGAEYILLTNNDVKFDRNIIKEGIRVALSDKNIGYVGGKVFDIEQKKILQYAGGRFRNCFDSPNRGKGELDIGQYDLVEDFDYMDDVTALVNVEMIKAIGPYDQDFFYDFEETEWNHRMIKSGWRIVYCPNMKVWHRLHGSTDGSKFSPIPEFHHIRGRFLFYFKTQKTSVFLRFAINYILFGIFIRLLILIKNNNTRLIYFNFRGMLSAFRRVISA